MSLYHLLRYRSSSRIHKCVVILIYGGGEEWKKNILPSSCYVVPFFTFPPVSLKSVRFIHYLGSFPPSPILLSPSALWFSFDAIVGTLQRVHRVHKPKNMVPLHNSPCLILRCSRKTYACLEMFLQRWAEFARCLSDHARVVKPKQRLRKSLIPIHVPHELLWSYTRFVWCKL